MTLVSTEINDGIALLRLSRGKVNALNEALVREIDHHLKLAEANEDVRTIVLTGTGKFFCLGSIFPSSWVIRRKPLYDT